MYVMSCNYVEFLFDLEVLHDLPHVLDGHDDEGGGAEKYEAPDGREPARHPPDPLNLHIPCLASMMIIITQSCCTDFGNNSQHV